MLRRTYHDALIQALKHYSELISRKDKASAVIDAVHYYGTNVSKWPAAIKTAVKMIASNCYWNGLFGEQGMKCYRCNKPKCQYRM